MHQEHNIPWNLAAKNVKFVRDNPAYTPRRTGLFARGLPSQTNEVNHFVRAMTTTIRTFSDTERQKYPEAQQFPAPTSGKLYSDELKSKYPEFLNDDNQLVETWISRANQSPHMRVDGAAAFCTSHGDLADVVKVLIIENQLPALLMLTHHPLIPLASLHHLSWGHHFGFSRVMEEALRAYIFFNLISALDQLANGCYREIEGYKYLIHSLIGPMDYDAQQIPHRLFMSGYGRGSLSPGRLPEVHHDLAKLKEYLKVCFSLLYKYDLIVRECGGDPSWERELAYCLAGLVHGLKVPE